MTNQESVPRISRPPIFGLEWKDFLGFLASALALSISLLTALSQYVETYTIKAQKDRQILYVSYRIGHNLANAYSNYELNPTAVNTSPQTPLSIASSQLAAINIKLNASDINLYSYDFGAAVWRYSKSSSSTGFDQINDLLETYYGTKSSQLFKAAYFLTLSKYAIQLIPDDKHGDLNECGLWQKSGADAVEAIRKDFGFSKIVGADCANISVKQFADKLRGVEGAIKVKLSNRSAALN